MTETSSVASHLGPLFREQGRFVWGLAYRMTGSATDADDILQETFARALDRNPTTERDLRPWLTAVAVNLGRDALRRRRRRSYVGPWLPSPVDDEVKGPWAPDAGVAFERREGAMFAFVLALEVLTPQQRGVLLLRDVFDRSVEETAAALGISETRVKVTHHRARARLKAATANGSPSPAVPRATEATLTALTRFVTALTTEDDGALLACLTDGVRVLSDGGGEFMAALKPVLGADRVMRFFAGLRRKLGSDGRFEVRSVNGEPTLIAEQTTHVAKAAPRWLLRVEVAPDGRIAELHLVAASAKLTHVRPIDGGTTRVGAGSSQLPGAASDLPRTV
jgi:RNA polymerase sigma-70 factor (ECF subfamily)